MTSKPLSWRTSYEKKTSRVIPALLIRTSIGPISSMTRFDAGNTSLIIRNIQRYTLNPEAFERVELREYSSEPDVSYTYNTNKLYDIHWLLLPVVYLKHCNCIHCAYENSHAAQLFSNASGFMCIVGMFLIMRLVLPASNSS